MANYLRGGSLVLFALLVSLWGVGADVSNATCGNTGFVCPVVYGASKSATACSSSTCTQAECCTVSRAYQATAYVKMVIAWDCLTFSMPYFLSSAANASGVPLEALSSARVVCGSVTVWVTVLGASPTLATAGLYQLLAAAQTGSLGTVIVLSATVTTTLITTTTYVTTTSSSSASSSSNTVNSNLSSPALFLLLILLMIPVGLLAAVVLWALIRLYYWWAARRAAKAVPLCCAPAVSLCYPACGSCPAVAPMLPCASPLPTGVFSPPTPCSPSCTAACGVVTPYGSGQWQC
eukprot:RCo020177